MPILVTGGLGFLGQKICEKALGGGVHMVGKVDNAVPKLVIWDFVKKAIPSPLQKSASSGDMILFSGDISHPEDVSRAFDLLRCTGGDTISEPLSIFHLASVMSGQAEEDFDIAVKVNIQGTLELLQACRAWVDKTNQGGGRPHRPKPRFIFTSSIAAPGPTRMLGTGTRVQPQSTYGWTKAACEMMVLEYSRKGWVDGRVCRLPTVAIRPGPPSSATTSCFSNITKTMLQGKDYSMPIAGSLPHPVIGAETAVTGIIATHNLPEEKIDTDRIINLPAVNTSLTQLAESTRRVAAEQGLPCGKVHEGIDMSVEAVVSSMVQAVDNSQADVLGIPKDGSIDDIVMDYVRQM